MSQLDPVQIAALSAMIATVISLGMIWIYLWGYRDGVKYCMKQLDKRGKNECA